jgi:transposase-like protein
VKKPARPAIFKGRQTEPVFILCAVRWYLRYSLSLRDIEELMVERGLETDHTTIWRWVPTLWSGTGTAAPPSPQTDQQILAGR